MQRLVGRKQKLRGHFRLTFPHCCQLDSLSTAHTACNTQACHWREEEGLRMMRMSLYCLLLSKALYYLFIYFNSLIAKPVSNQSAAVYHFIARPRRADSHQHLLQGC